MLAWLSRTILACATLVAIGTVVATADEAADLVQWLNQAPGVDAEYSGPFADAEGEYPIDENGASYGPPAADGFTDFGDGEVFEDSESLGAEGSDSPAYCRGCQIPGWTVAPDCATNGCIGPTWFAGAEYFGLQRSSAPRFNLSGVVSVVPSTNPAIAPTIQRTVVMTTRDLDFNFASGARLTVGRFLGTDFLKRVHSVEFQFYGFYNYASDHFVTQPSQTFVVGNPPVNALTTGNLVSFFSPLASDIFTGTALAGFTGATLQSASYSSNFNNYELNYRIRRTLGRDSIVAQPDGSWKRQCTPGVTPSFLVGLRAISISEAFHFHSQGQHVLFNSAGAPTFSNDSRGDYDVRTTNFLFGPQIGADVIQQFCRFNFGFRSKLGVMANWISQRSVITASDVPTLLNPSGTFSAAGQHPAYVSEFGFFGNWHVRSNLNIKAGYDWIFVNELALGPQNLVTLFRTTPPRVLHNGHTTFTGPSVGLEFFW